MNSSTLPVLCGCDLCAATEPFYHSDRITPFNVMIYVVDGTISVTEDENDHEICPGELLFLKSGIRHYGKKEIPRGTRWYFIHFYMEDSLPLPRFEPDNTPFVQYEKTEHSAILPKYLSGLSGSRLETGIKEFTEYFFSDDPMKKWDINCRLFSLLSAIAFYGKTSPKEPSLSDRIKSYIDENYRRPFSSKALEKEFFLSYKHMAAVFRRETGLTMQQYHFSLQMNEACRLLRSTLMSVGEIAGAVGFSDPLYFSRCFSGCIGTCPTQYRRNEVRR